MELITAALPLPVHPANPPVDVPVDRHTLAKRRWRGVATDGRELGFDLERPLKNGDLVFGDGTHVYRIAQKPEPVLSVALHHPEDAARLGWLLGNLHFQIAVMARTVLAPDDPAIRQMLEREHIDHQPAHAVFIPLGGSHSHH